MLHLVTLWLLAAPAGFGSLPSNPGAECRSDEAAFSALVFPHRLDRTELLAVLRVAETRRALGQEPLPDFPFCASIDYVEASLHSSPESVAALARERITSRTYALTLWSVVLARYEFPAFQQAGYYGRDNVRYNVGLVSGDPVIVAAMRRLDED